jgi:hypothetical protein
MVYGSRAIDENDRKLTVSARAGLKGRLMDNPGLYLLADL